MGMVARVRSACRNMFHAAAAERDLDAEIRSQLDLLIEDHVARGIPRDKLRDSPVSNSAASIR